MFPQCLQEKVGMGIFFHTKPHFIIHNCHTSQEHVIYSYEVSSFNKLRNNKYEKFSGLLWCETVRELEIMHSLFWMFGCVALCTPYSGCLDVWPCALLILDVCVIDISTHSVRYPLVV